VERVTDRLSAACEVVLTVAGCCVVVYSDGAPASYRLQHAGFQLVRHRAPHTQTSQLTRNFNVHVSSLYTVHLSRISTLVSRLNSTLLVDFVGSSVLLFFKFEMHRRSLVISNCMHDIFSSFC